MWYSVWIAHKGGWSATNRVANGGLDAQMSKMLWGNGDDEVERAWGRELQGVRLLSR